MSDEPTSQVMPAPHRRRTPWPGLVWSIPLAALMVVAYLGFHAWTRRGEVVTVTFRRAADARANDTKVLYQGVEAGHLIRIVPNPDGRRLDFLLRLTPEAKAGLNSNARFWLIGANPNFSDLSSLKAVVSGVAIGYAPGEGGTPTTHFEGLDHAPTVLPGDRGTRYVLEARTLGPISEGSGVLFHGQSIGRVTGVKFDNGSFRVEIFVFQPYDALIKAGTRFWKMSPLRLSLAGGGLNASLAPASTLLSGGIDMEPLPAELGNESNAAQSPATTVFTLYPNHAAARQGLAGPTVRYNFTFEGAAGTIEEEAAVTLLGFQIGEVEATRLDYAEHSGRPYTTVTALIYPRQLGLPDKMGPSADWRAVTDTKIRELLRLGYRARLQQTPALIGDQSIALVEIAHAKAADLGSDGLYPLIPSAPGATDVADIAAQADQILTKINAIPLQEIGDNLRQITHQLNALVSSPKMADSVAHLNSTLREVDQMLADVQPQVGPLVAKLNAAAGEISATATAARQLIGSDGSTPDSLPETLRELTEAARSVRNLTEYLDRHPEALIRGKGPEK